MRWRSVSVIAAVSVALVAASAVWFLSDTNRLVITVSGLPDGVDGRVTVSGPDGDSYRVTDRDDREVPPGEYRLRIGEVRHDGATNYAAVDETEVTVPAGETTKHTVRYEINIPDTTTVITDDDTGAVEKIDEDAIVFASGELADSVDENGFVIDTDTEDGLLVRRVTKLRHDDGDVVAETEKATLSEALPKGVIEIGAAYTEKHFEDKPLFELGFGGLQTGMQKEQNDRNGNPNGKSGVCALETPPATFALNKFRITPDVRYTWNAFTGDRTVDTSLSYQTDAELKLAGRIDAKCSVEAKSEKFDVGKLCDRGLAKLVRLGPFNLTCDADIVTKANMSIPSGNLEGKWRQGFDFKASGGVDADGKPHGGIDSTRTSDASLKLEQKHFTVGLEMGVEVKLGAELLETLGVSLIYESSVGVEGTKGAFKVPFKGKVFVRFSAEAGSFEKFHDLQILHWSKDLYEYETPDKKKDEGKDDKKTDDDKDKSAKVTITQGEHRDLDVLGQAADTFTDNEGERLDVDITGAFDETFEVWTPDPGGEFGGTDNAIILGTQCWSDSGCAPLILHFPPEYELLTDNPGSDAGVPVTVKGKFTVDEVFVNSQQQPTDHLPDAEGTHVSLIPA